MTILNNQTNLIIAMILTALVVLVFDMYRDDASESGSGEVVTENVTQDESGDPLQPEKVTPEPVAPVVAASYPLLNAQNSLVSGRIHLQGAFITDVELSAYQDRIGSPEPVSLLNSRGGRLSNYAAVSWNSSDPDLQLPDASTLWEADGTRLEPDVPLTLSWRNDQGVTFQIIYRLDDKYLLQVEQKVINTSDNGITVYPYAYLERRHLPADLASTWLSHQGITGYLNGNIEEVDYEDLDETPSVTYQNNTGGWISFADRYWLMALIFPQDQDNVRALAAKNKNGYRVAFAPVAAQTIAPKTSASLNYQIYLGPKDTRILGQYQDFYSIPSFSDAVNLGWLYFIGKPILMIFNFIHNYVANFGLVIVLATILLKLIFFPISRYSQRMSNSMRLLKPEMDLIKERFKDDKERVSTEMMNLYRKYKINPLVMFLPLLIQIPIFFSFYRVLWVNIDLRHAPLLGWVNDLSVPDPTNILNLFGYLPLEVPFALQVSVMSLLAGILLWLQIHYGPSAGGSKSHFMMLMPVFLVFVLARVPAGILLYIIVNALLTVTEQGVGRIFGAKNKLGNRQS